MAATRRGTRKAHHEDTKDTKGNAMVIDRDRVEERIEDMAVAVGGAIREGGEVLMTFEQFGRWLDVMRERLVPPGCVACAGLFAPHRFRELQTIARATDHVMAEVLEVDG